MEKLKKKKKYYFPYRIFNFEHKAKSQINIFERNNNSSLNSINIPNTKTTQVNKFVKQLKSTILSSKIFSKYMDNYIGQTQDFCFKSPGNTVYPLKKNYQFLPINFKKSQIIEDPIDDNKKDNDNEINSVVAKPYGFKYKKTKIIIDKDKDFYQHINEERQKSKIFMSFSEGNFYSNELLKTFGLNNIDISNNTEIIKSNFEYLNESIIKIQTLVNFTSTNSIEFKIKNHFNNQDIQFNMNIFSLCFKFYEIKEDPEKKNNLEIINKHKLYLPFKLIPFFYLLNYTYFKKFISEIIYYDKKTKSMNFNPEKFGQILKKSSFYLRNVYQKNNKDFYNDITFYKNEFVYNNCYDWIIINEKNNIKENIIYKIKIIFPKVIFEEKNNKIKVINYISKNILIRVLKMNFLDWEKFILFDLFSNKKFRYLINNILIGGTKYYEKTIKLYERKLFSGVNNILKVSTINKAFSTFNKSNKNYEFFLCEASKNQSYYYKFIPNIILIIIGEQKKQFQKIILNLKESRKLFELSKYWGAINTLFKCMYKDEMNNKIFFKLNILEDMPKELYKTIRNENNMRNSLHYKNMNLSSASSSNKEKSNYMRYKSNEIELALSECLLNIMNINFNEAKFIYYKVPNNLLNTILTCNNNMKIVNCIINCYDEIINNKNEIDILKEERTMYKKIYENKKEHSFLEKNRYERHPTIGQNKINPSKTYNKNKLFFNKIINNNKNNFAKSYGKQKTSYLDNRNTFMNKLEKKNLEYGSESKKNNNIRNFNDSPEKNEIENLPIIPVINKIEGMNENLY